MKRSPTGLCTALLALCSLSGVATCAGSEAGGPVALSDEPTVSVTPSTLALFPGQSATATLTVTRKGFTKPLSLNACGSFGSTMFDCRPLPVGITVTFSPSTLTGDAVTSTVTVTVGSDAQATSFPLGIGITAVNGDDGGNAVLNLSVVFPLLTVARSGSGSGTVTSSPAGIGCGSSCSHQFAVGTAVTLTASPAAGSAFAGWSGGCSGTSTTCTVTMAYGPSNVTATFNSTAPSVSVAVTPALVSIPQGASGTATVNITRANFTGPVNLAISGAPAGLTVTGNLSSVTADASTLGITAPLSLAAGNYPLTVTATGAGAGQATATFNVQVTPAAGGSGNVAFSFATCDPSQVPIWFAVQNGTGAWSRVIVGANNTFTFPVSTSVGIAYVTQNGTSFSTSVLYTTGSQLTSAAIGDVCRSSQTGAKQLNGTFAGVGSLPVFATVSIGGADTTYILGQGASFTLQNVPAGARDLIAGLHAHNQSNPAVIGLQKLIIRRSVNYAAGAAIPELNFGSAESFAPVQHNGTISNLGADPVLVNESFVTSNGGSAPFHSETKASGPGNMVRYYSFPDSLLQPTDLHVIELQAVSSADTTNSRFIFMFLHTATDQALTLGPALATPTVSSVGATPYLRPRAQFASQSNYNSGASAQFAQNNGNSVEVSASIGYFGGLPSTWTLDVPDLTSAAYDPKWGLRSGAPVSWGAAAFAGDFLVFAGATLVDGAQIVGAATEGSVSAFSALRRIGSGWAPWRP